MARCLAHFVLGDNKFVWNMHSPKMTLLAGPGSFIPPWANKNMWTAKHLSVQIFLPDKCSECLQMAYVQTLSLNVFKTPTKFIISASKSSIEIRFGSRESSNNNDNNNL